MNSSATSNPPLSRPAKTLRDAGRTPPVPFCVQLKDGRSVAVTRLLRVLPKKRVTGEGRLNGERVLVKLFISRKAARHGAREARGLSELERAGLPAPPLSACGAIRGGGYAVITGFFTPAKTLGELWRSAESSAGKKELLAEALRLLGRLHAAGLTHRDLHPGNFLQHHNTVYILDGDAVRPVNPLPPFSKMTRQKDLAVLLSLFPEASAADSSQLIEIYHGGNPSLQPDPIGLQQTVEQIRSKQIAGFLKKSVRDSTPFCVHRSFLRFTAAVRKEADALAGLIEDPDKAVENGQRLKTGGSSTVSRITLPDRDVVIKRYNLKNRRHAFSRLWRPSRAWRSWMAGLRLRQSGVDTPEPLALIEERFGPLRRRAWLITAFCPGIPLPDHLDPQREPPAAEAAAVSAFFTVLHRERIYHGDLKGTNLLWHEGRLTVIDLDAAKKLRCPAACRRAWQKDRTRFLRNWPTDCVLFRWLDARLPR